MSDLVTVAIPVRNGGRLLEQTLTAVFAQVLPAGWSLHVLICDSGSRDGSAALARSLGAEVFKIAPESFSHGGTRNLLLERAEGRRVALLTQDSVPADTRWLARLLDGFELAPDIALTFGPYRPRPEASPMVAHEITRWFHLLAPDGMPRIDRLEQSAPAVDARSLLGARAFFTDANGCVERTAWQTIPFRQVPYAEDHVLAIDMMRAGYAKAYLPGAAVVHSHEYSLRDWMRRSFDEQRAIQAVYELSEPLRPRQAALMIWGKVGGDRRWARPRGPVKTLSLLFASALHHTARTAGAVLGSRAAGLPRWVAQALSLENRP